jgi:putative transposase
MTKLNERKIRWIMRELGGGELSVRQIARTQKISARRVRQLREHYNNTGKSFQLCQVRQTRRRIPTPEEEALVLAIWRKYLLGSTILEKIIDKTQNAHVPHNVIQKILNGKGIGMPLKSKIRRKAWVRFERKHSNSMWHTDWTMLEDGSWLIAYEDDASRLIVGAGIFDSPTTEASLFVLREAIRRYGQPREMLTGRDSQFYCSEAEGKIQGKTDFQIFLAEVGIKHIVGRVNHPQTNGKQERFFGTVKAKLEYFSSLEDLIVWYNEVKPHMSLDFDNLETPAQAYVRKMHHKAVQQPLLVSSR